MKIGVSSSDERTLSKRAKEHLLQRITSTSKQRFHLETTENSTLQTVSTESTEELFTMMLGITHKRLKK